MRSRADATTGALTVGLRRNLLRYSCAEAGEPSPSFLEAGGRFFCFLMLFRLFDTRLGSEFRNNTTRAGFAPSPVH